MNPRSTYETKQQLISNKHYKKHHTVDLSNKTTTNLPHFKCLIMFKTKSSLLFIQRVDLVLFTVLFFCFPLWRHIFKFRVQFPLQVGFLIGIHGFVFLPTPGIKNAFFAYSHPSVRLGFVSTAVHLGKGLGQSDQRKAQNFTRQKCLTLKLSF